jgi:hypothetical protein
VREPNGDVDRARGVPHRPGAARPATQQIVDLSEGAAGDVMSVAHRLAPVAKETVAPRRDQEPRERVRDVLALQGIHPGDFATILEAQKHAIEVVLLIAKYYLLPRFGMTSYPRTPF